jgi:hypothetical protein
MSPKAQHQQDDEGNQREEKAELLGTGHRFSPRAISAAFRCRRT